MADKLIYFNIPGRAEIARLILAHSGEDFIDHRISKKEFDGMKDELPFGQVPLLETVEDGVIAQSMTIARYLANKYDLVGADDMQRAQAEEIVDAINDIMEPLFAVIVPNDPKERKEKNEEAIEKFRSGAVKLEKRLEMRGGQFFAGNTVTWADLHFTNAVLLLKKLNGYKALDGCPLLRDLDNRICALPNISKWIKQHWNM